MLTPAAAIPIIDIVAKSNTTRRRNAYALGMYELRLAMLDARPSIGPVRRLVVLRPRIEATTGRNIGRWLWLWRATGVIVQPKAANAPLEITDGLAPSEAVLLTIRPVLAATGVILTVRIAERTSLVGIIEIAVVQRLPCLPLPAKTCGTALPMRSRIIEMLTILAPLKRMEGFFPDCCDQLQWIRGNVVEAKDDHPATRRILVTRFGELKWWQEKPRHSRIGAICGAPELRHTLRALSLDFLEEKINELILLQRRD